MYSFFQSHHCFDASVLSRNRVFVAATPPVVKKVSAFRIDVVLRKSFHHGVERAKYILCVGLTPAWQETMEFNRLQPGEVNRCKAITRSAAGKGANVARVLNTLGASTVLLTFCGGENGKLWLDDLKEAGVRADIIRTHSAMRICQTLIDQSTGDITELVREAPLPLRDEWASFFRRFESRLRRAKLVVIAGALMPGAKDTVYRDLVRLTRSRGVPVLIDSQKTALMRTLPHRPLLVKLNVHELEDTLGRSLRSERQIVAGARRFVQRGARQVVVTHGPRSAWLVLPSHVWRFTPPRIQAVNAIGSGDAVTAGIVRGIVKGLDIVEAVRLGIACGAANALTLTPGDVDVQAVRKLAHKVVARVFTTA
jgi:1-phosphofructokinase family hexose kinase